MMSISDALMWRYAELLSDRDIEEVKNIHEQVAGGSVHPMDFKKSLADEIVCRFHGPAAAASARDYFETRHQKRSVPKNIAKRFAPPDRVRICQLLVDLGFAKSKGEARRLIAQRAVKIDGQLVTDVDFEFQGKLHRLIEVGKTRIAQAADGA
jgi:tyrosyl-tRNA synthetase